MVQMTLEEYIAHLNSLAFWKEFTFAQNKFAPRPGEEFELADNLAWLGDHAFVLQLKERASETENPDSESNWFRKKVLGKAMSQVRDTLRFLEEHDEISVTNERGHAFKIRNAELLSITKIVVFLAGRALPEDCWNTRYHISRTAGFIHVVAAHDYLGILEKLRVPEDIRRYFAYREEVVPRLREAGLNVGEADIMGAFLNEDDLPNGNSKDALHHFIQDLDGFDLSRLIGNIHNHIERSDQPNDYYKIMLEFARVPRSVWREVKTRFMLSLDAVKKKEFRQPYRLTFPATDCTFMIAPFDPELVAVGTEGEKLRVTGLQNLTYAAMYDAKVSKGVGILISKDGEYLQLDWAWLDIPWAVDSEMEAKFSKSNPFRVAKERMIDSFLFSTSS